MAGDFSVEPYLWKRLKNDDDFMYTFWLQTFTFSHIGRKIHTSNTANPENIFKNYNIKSITFQVLNSENIKKYTTI